MSRVILITGASRGIGAQTAKLAAQRGYALCLNYRSDRQSAEALQQSLAGDGCDVMLYQANVAILSIAIFRMSEDHVFRGRHLVTNVPR